MAIKINSINIRRFYHDEELEVANRIRELQMNINDIKTLEKLRQLRNAGITYSDDYSELTWEELQEVYLSEKWDAPTIKYRDSKKVNAIKSFLNKNEKYISKKEVDAFSRQNEELKQFRKEIKNYKENINERLVNNKKTRTLSKTYFSDLVALSSSALTSSLNISDEETSDTIVIVTVDQSFMMRDLINDGFFYNGEEYILYSASAGQLRKKKIMFVEKTALAKALPKLTNGLTIEIINSLGGVNINKWSAYLALSTSATKIWKGVDLNRICIVDDFETTLKNREVDYIDENYEIHRIKKDVTIPHTDGFGMMHPSFCRDTRMIRAPWIKGLVSPMDFRSFVRTFNGKETIEDIWGESYHIDDLDIILTKSQFKMWKYYDSWEDYKYKFKENECEFRYMIPESKKDLRLNAMLNYQMWNTLDIDNRVGFAEKMLSDDKCKIEKAHSEVNSMLDMFHVDKDYKRNNHLQKALYLYPPILKNNGFKKMLKDNITARKKEMRQGRVKINGVYTFIIPDVFAWCEYLFLDIEYPDGLLCDGEVSCKLVNKDKDIVVNRSPHLYKEWCIRKNIKEKEHIRWFIGKGVYTSVHDMISKQLFFDVDGDIGLVIENDDIVRVAKDTMKDVVPLDFRLEKAPAQIINNKNIYESYNLAFGANIGYYSNLITKVMNGDDRDFELVAKICWINNQVIDFAKTKWKLEPTEKLQEQLAVLDKKKLPYFFIWAKDKPRNSVAPPNGNSLVDQMAILVDNMENRTKFNYRNIQDLDVSIMMSNENAEPNEELINKFKSLANAKYQSMIRKRAEGDRNFRNNYVNNQIRNEMYEYCMFENIDFDDAVDVCVKHVFENNRERDALFTIFGDILVDRLEQRFPELLDGSYTRCSICGDMIMNSNRKVIYCDKCAKKIDRKKAKERMREKRC